MRDIQMIDEIRFTREQILSLPSEYCMVNDHENVIVLEFIETENNYIITKEVIKKTNNKIKIVLKFETENQKFNLVHVTPGYFVGITQNRRMVKRAKVQLAEAIKIELPKSKFDWRETKKEFESFVVPNHLYGFELRKAELELPHYIDLAYGGEPCAPLITASNEKFKYWSKVQMKNGKYNVDFKKDYPTLQDAFEGFVVGIKKRRLKTLF